MLILNQAQQDAIRHIIQTKSREKISNLIDIIKSKKNDLYGPLLKSFQSLPYNDKKLQQCADILKTHATGLEIDLKTFEIKSDSEGYLIAHWNKGNKKQQKNINDTIHKHLQSKQEAPLPFPLSDINLKPEELKNLENIFAICSAGFIINEETLTIQTNQKGWPIIHWNQGNKKQQENIHNIIYKHLQNKQEAPLPFPMSDLNLEQKEWKTLENLLQTSAAGFEINGKKQTLKMNQTNSDLIFVPTNNKQLYHISKWLYQNLDIKKNAKENSLFQEVPKENFYAIIKKAYMQCTAQLCGLHYETTENRNLLLTYNPKNKNNDFGEDTTQNIRSLALNLIDIKPIGIRVTKETKCMALLLLEQYMERTKQEDRQTRKEKGHIHMTTININNLRHQVNRVSHAHSLTCELEMNGEPIQPKNKSHSSGYKTTKTNNSHQHMNDNPFTKFFQQSAENM